ncbi:uncharacterized protein [Parasteatoda tepidariorum]|uniref:uncharacterized protein n=1 Tax=Parasteatoda tepidariorum TaxID=114398 RepID=UPI001C721190|nr:uncharacterized protein LOC110283475 [Parasteatoda tepidariorum]
MFFLGGIQFATGDYRCPYCQRIYSNKRGFCFSQLACSLNQSDPNLRVQCGKQSLGYGNFYVQESMQAERPKKGVHFLDVVLKSEFVEDAESNVSFELLSKNCSLCEKTFEEKDLETHIRLSHNPTVYIRDDATLKDRDPDEPVTLKTNKSQLKECQFCHRNFDRKSTRYENHIANCRVQKALVKCIYCDKTFTKEAFSKHI